VARVAPWQNYIAAGAEQQQIATTFLKRLFQIIELVGLMQHIRFAFHTESVPRLQ
tara:strand:+ start:433 stop:597 length:165 start_codon:yes stop_codon:yes gene_type:complete